MPYIKVPGIDREILFELHEPRDQETPWFVAAGTKAELTPEQMAIEMTDPKTEWDFSYSHEVSLKCTSIEAESARVKARSFEPMLRAAQAAQIGASARGRGRGGRPRDTGFSPAEDIAVIATFFVQKSVKRQAAINSAVDYWINGNARRKEPAKRLIDAAMARIRRGGITGLIMSVVAVRKKYGLPEIPMLVSTPGKPQKRIK